MSVLEIITAFSMTREYIVLPRMVYLQRNNEHHLSLLKYVFYFAVNYEYLCRG